MVFLVLFTLLLSFLAVDANRCRFRESRVGEQTIIRMTRGCRGAGTMIDEDYWTSIGYDGAIRDGRSQDDFLTFPRDVNNYHDIRNGYVAYWITRSKYGSNHHYEAFGHAFVRPDRRICAWFVGLNNDVQEVCGGFRVLSRSRRNPREQNPFEWIQGETVQLRDTLGFHHHRIAKYESPTNDVLYGDARIQDHNFQGVSPLSQNFIEVTTPSEFYSRVWLLRRRSDVPSRYLDEKYRQNLRYIQNFDWNPTHDQDHVYDTNQQISGSPYKQELTNHRIINPQYRPRLMQLPSRFPNGMSTSWKENNLQNSRHIVRNTQQHSPNIFLSEEQLINKRVSEGNSYIAEHQSPEGIESKENFGNSEDEYAENLTSRTQANIESRLRNNQDSERSEINSEIYLDSERRSNSGEDGIYQGYRDGERRLVAPLRPDNSGNEISAYNGHNIEGGGAPVGHLDNRKHPETRGSEYHGDISRYSHERHEANQVNTPHTGSEPTRQLVRYITMRPPIILKDQFGREYETRIENGNIYYYADPHTQLDLDELNKYSERKDQEKNQHPHEPDQQRDLEHFSMTMEQRQKQEADQYNGNGERNKESAVEQQLGDSNYVQYRDHIKRIMDERHYQEAKLREKDLEEMRKSGLDKRLDDAALRYREYLRRMQEYRRQQELRWRQEAEEWLQSHQHTGGCKGQPRHKNYEKNSLLESALDARSQHDNELNRDRESDTLHLREAAFANAHHF